MSNYRFAFVTDAQLKDALTQWEDLIGRSDTGKLIQDYAQAESETIRRELLIREAYDTITEAHMDAFKAIQATLDGNFTATVDMIVSMGASHEKGMAYRRIFTTGRQF